ncbi:MAG: hypothetical protein ACK2T0_08695 [Anaerolineales bacterium]
MSPATDPRIGRRESAKLNGSLWVWISVAAALVAVLGNIVGLMVPAIYARLTPAFLAQAYAQDVANVALVAPAWLVLAALTLRGSVRARLLWLGVLLFAVYNYVIYTLSVPFGPLFLLWVAVLGLSFYALLGGILTTDQEQAAASLQNRLASRVTGWVLLVLAVLFAALWLSEDVPALLSGTTPASVVDLGIPTNVVHVLDLAFFLPGAAVCGILLLRGRAVGYALAPGFLAFLVLTGMPIVLTPIVQSARGEPAQWGVTGPIGILSLMLLGLLVWLLTERPKA